MFHLLNVCIMNVIVIISAYFLFCTLGAIVTQFTGHSGRNFREAILVWWFLPLVFLYVFTSLIFEGTDGFGKSMKDFRNELLNID